MTATQRPAPPAGTDALLRQIDRHMAHLRFASGTFPAPRDPTAYHPAAGDPAPSRPVPWARERLAAVDLELAERIARSLRRLVRDTAHSSAADRARVRAAVHYFVLIRDGSDDRRSRGLLDDVQVVNDILTDLGRADLVVRPRS